jgi:hypothetical protein
VTARLELKKHAPERNSVKNAGKQSAKAAETASRRVPNMRNSKKNVISAALVLAGLSFFSGQFGFSSEKVQAHSVSAG